MFMTQGDGKSGREGDVHRLDSLMLNDSQKVAKAKEAGKILGNTHAQTDSLLGGLESGLEKPLHAGKQLKKPGEKASEQPAEPQARPSSEAKESAEKTKYRKIEYKDAVTGYKVTLHVPEGQNFDPKNDKVSFYFPGDGRLGNALEDDKPGKRLLDKLPKGVYAVVAGGAKTGSQKYARFDNAGKAWDSLVHGVGEQLGVKEDEKITTEMLAHSRGGGALNRLLAAGKVMPGRVVVLDTCHESLTNVLKYIGRGGKVDFCYDDARTLQSAANFKSTLEKQYGVKFVADANGVLVSGDGRVKIYPRFTNGHGAVFATYLDLVKAQEPVAAKDGTTVNYPASTVAASGSAVPKSAVSGGVGHASHSGSSTGVELASTSSVPVSATSVFRPSIRPSEALRGLVGASGVLAIAEQYNIKPLLRGKFNIDALMTMAADTQRFQPFTIKGGYNFDAYKDTGSVGNNQCASTVSAYLGLERGNGAEGYVANLLAKLIASNLAKDPQNPGFVFGTQNFQPGDVVFFGNKHNNYGHTGIVRDRVEVDGCEYFVLSHDQFSLDEDMIPVNAADNAKANLLAEKLNGSGSANARKEYAQRYPQLKSIFAYREKYPDNFHVRKNENYFGDVTQGGGRLLFAVRTAGLVEGTGASSAGIA